MKYNKNTIFGFGIALVMFFALAVVMGQLDITDSYIKLNGKTLINPYYCVVSTDTNRGDYTTVQECLSAITTGGTVYVRDGTYSSASALYIKSNSTLECESYNTVMKMTGNNHLLTNADWSGDEAIVIKNCHFIGNPSGSAGLGIYFENVSNSYIQNVWVEQVKQHGIQLQDSNNVMIQNVKSSHNTQDGITVLGNSYNIIISNSIASYNGDYGIGVFRNLGGDPEPSKVTIVGNQVISNRWGIHTKAGEHHVITNNYVYNSSQTGMQIGLPTTNGTNHSIISNNLVQDSDTSNSTYVGIDVRGCYNQVSNNNIMDSRGYQTYGLYIGNDCYNLISDNIVKESATADYFFTGHTTNVYWNNIGDTATGDYLNSKKITRNLAAADTSAPLMSLINDNSGDDQNALNIQQDGTGKGIFIDQNGNNIGLHIDHEGTSTNHILTEVSGSYTGDAWWLAANGMTTGTGIKVTSNSITTGHLFDLQDNAAGSSSWIQRIYQSGTGDGLFIDTNGNAHSINIDNEATSKVAIAFDGGGCASGEYGLYRNATAIYVCYNGVSTQLN